jgi:hypothetical protein
MGLRDLVIPTEVVKVADGEFTVRGLSPNDALGLYYRHAGQLSALFDQFTARSRTGEDVNVAEVGTSLVGGAPQIMAEIIAVASGSRAPRLDEPDIVKRAAQETEWLLDVQKAIDLPAGAQMDALEKVGAKRDGRNQRAEGLTEWLWGVRRQANLLLANGHPDAWDYPLSRVFDEASLIVERRNGELATMAVIIQSATATTGMGASKKSADHFKKLIKTLSEEH